MKIEISMGDFCDRHSILEIKQQKGLEVSKELQQYQLSKPRNDVNYTHYISILHSINSQLWDLEDRKREHVERYSKEESDTAFMITQLNDIRARVKKAIDKFYKSTITEMKSHKL